MIYDILVFFPTDSKGNALVVIDNVEYSLQDPPPESSRVVAEQKENILSAVNLDALVKGLTNVSTFVQMASLGVTGAGHTELQIKVQNIGVSVTKLASKSHTTIIHFRRACLTIVEALQATYEFLLLNMEDTATVMLTQVADVAGEMASAAKDLQLAFERETQNVISVLNDALNAKGMEKEKKKQLLVQMQEFDMMKKQAEKLQKDAIKAEEKSWKLFEDARRKQFKALKKDANPFKTLFNAFTSMTIGIQLFPTGANKDVAEAARQEKLVHLEYAQEQRKIQQKAVQQIAEYVLKIENCKDSSDLAEVAIDALQAAVGSLKALSVVMMRAAEFWERMHKHVDSLRKPLIEKEITAVMKIDAQKRHSHWTSNGFKTRAVRFYAQWVALHSVCTYYMNHLQLTQEKLYEVLEDNPTEESAREKLRGLAKKFGPELQKELKAIEDQSFKAGVEIQELSNQREEDPQPKQKTEL